MIVFFRVMGVQYCGGSPFGRYGMQATSQGNEVFPPHPRPYAFAAWSASLNHPRTNSSASRKGADFWPSWVD